MMMAMCHIGALIIKVTCWYRNRNIQNPATGSFPYQAQHVGIRPVNVNSTVQFMRTAYPTINFGNTNNALTLRQIIPGIISNR